MSNATEGEHRAMVLRCILAAAVFLAGGISCGAAGVTIVTHGFLSNASDWVRATAEAMARYTALGGHTSSVYEFYFVKDVGGSYLPAVRKLSGANPLESDSGEIFIALDWSQMSGDLSGVTYTTQDVAPTIASALTSTTFMADLAGHALAELPLHLVGHSRGGALMCEVARRLGERGVWVDQVTTLDPHPLNNNYDDSFVTNLQDAPAVPYENVLFADNYYQVNFLGLLDPSGQYVSGAYNRLLQVSQGGYQNSSPFAVNHSNVHLWYYGTVDLATPATDSVATVSRVERGRWWTSSEGQGQWTGEFFSLLGGGDRLSSEAPAGGTNQVRNGMNQRWDFGAGTAGNRSALAANSGEWPNILTFSFDGVRETNLSGGEFSSVETGGTLPVTLRLQAGQTGGQKSLMTFFLDPDANAFNSNAVAVATAEIAAAGTGAVVLTNWSISLPSLPQGLYALAAKISRGTAERYLYAHGNLLVREASRDVELGVPVVSGGKVQLEIFGNSGQQVVLQGATGLGVWTDLATNILVSGSWKLEQPYAGETNAVFFRARNWR